MRPHPHACVFALASVLYAPVVAQMNVGIGDTSKPLAGEVYNPGVGVKLEDRRQGDIFFPIVINHWWGHMNQQGDIIIWPQFDWTDYEFDGLIRVVTDGRTGFINRAGGCAIPARYEWADRFSEGQAVVRENGKYGMIDKTGKLVLPTKADGALRFSEGFAAVQVGDRCGFIDRRMAVVVEPRYARVRSFHDGLAMVQAPASPGEPANAGVLGYLDKRGRFAFLDEKRRFTDLGDFYDGLARAQAGGKWGFIDKSFKMRIDAQWDNVDDFSDGLAAVVRGGRVGYIDKSGKLVVPLGYRTGEQFSEGLAMVEADQKWGFVNRTGDARVPPTFAWAEPYFRRYARVATEPNFAYIGVNGNEVWHPRRPFDAIWDRTTGGLARITLDILDPPKVNGFVQRQTGLTLAPPPPREPWPSPYRAEYLYIDELPVR